MRGQHALRFLPQHTSKHFSGAVLRLVRALTRRSGILCQVSMSCGLATRPTNFCPKRCGLTVEKPVWSTCHHQASNISAILCIKVCSSLVLSTSCM